MEIGRSFRDPAAVGKLVARIAAISRRPARIMEFCGTHTHAVCRYGIRDLLPARVEMLSGPGCPVCVTDNRDLDYALALAAIPGVIIATFGDLVKVPGSRTDLQRARAGGARVEVVYSPLDALDLARKNKDDPVVFLGAGFETTAPTVAASILEAEREGTTNYYVYSMHKITPPAMRVILDAGEVHVEGILCPGHVSTVIGWQSWSFLASDYRLPAAVAGFEPVDILWAIAEILMQLESGQPLTANTYPRSVTGGGNAVAREMMEKVFEKAAASWRGLGVIPESGLAIREEYGRFDAARAFDVDPGETVVPAGCRCGDVIRGVMKPGECPLFRNGCTPLHPVGPCMVSSEGTCAAYYLYG